MFLTSLPWGFAIPVEVVTFKLDFEDLAISFKPNPDSSEDDSTDSSMLFPSINKFFGY